MTRNPAISWRAYDAFPSQGAALRSARDLKRAFPTWSVLIKKDPEGGRLPWVLFVIERPSRRPANPRRRNPLSPQTMNIFLATIAETPEGAPEGHLYAGMMQAGWNISDFYSAVDFSLQHGLLEKKMDVLYPTEKLTAAFRKAKGNPLRRFKRGGLTKIYGRT